MGLQLAGLGGAEEDGPRWSDTGEREVQEKTPRTREDGLHRAAEALKKRGEAHPC